MGQTMPPVMSKIYGKKTEQVSHSFHYKQFPLAHLSKGEVSYRAIRQQALSAYADTCHAQDHLIGNGLNLDARQLLIGIDPDLLHSGMVRIVEVEDLSLCYKRGRKPIVDAQRVHKFHIRRHTVGICYSYPHILNIGMQMECA